MKLLLRIKYDGTAYAGYQVQKNAATVQQRLNEAVADLFGFECDVTGCSRTDAGVHALCFYATVEKRGSPSLETAVPVEKIPLALNVRLPDDIAVCEARFVSEDFHARYSVLSKTYEYKISDSPFRDPFALNRAYHYPTVISDVQISLMQEAANNICGKHDFKSFMASGSSVSDTVRTVYSCTVERTGDYVVIRICADGFLYNMVRIICGTLIEVAKGNSAPSDICEIIGARDRKIAGPTLPPEGLYLAEVNYPEDSFDF
ncbi:MAG: tRNA pseudouridine(38-40) synthase TruA [Eubacteriales bacterium]